MEPTQQAADAGSTGGEIADRIASVRERIAQAAARSGRPPEAIRLVAVTKTVEAARISQAVRAGVTDLGENYVQEARTKSSEVATALLAAHSEPPPLIWHLIGHLQRNKAKYCADLFSLIHSVDNYQLAQELGKQAAKHGKTQPILIEVNLAGLPERAGVAPNDTLALAERVAQVPHLAVRGLMGMAPFSSSDDPEQARPHFARLRGLWDCLPADCRHTLSMGMSGDFEIAIEEGATLVRVGTALFGQRL
jgi:hypothetical protein